MTAFNRAWAIVKESGPPLNRIEPGEWMEHPEGYQDFRFTQPHKELAGNFPDNSGYNPTRSVVRGNGDVSHVTMTPAGSNINLNRMRMATHFDDWDKSRESDVPLSPQTEDFLIDDMQSTGRHEAVHQAVHEMLMELGYKSPYFGASMPDEREPYHRATEWAANLLQHTDPMRAWNALRTHPQFEDDEAVQDIAERRMYP